MPSIDPELLPRLLLIGHLYVVTSERKLVEELRMHRAWRWFSGLGFDHASLHVFQEPAWTIPEIESVSGDPGRRSSPAAERPDG
ncbi:MAG: transposase [Candidatus Sulfotelmatobacter sp.]